MSSERLRRQWYVAGVLPTSPIGLLQLVRMGAVLGDHLQIARETTRPEEKQGAYWGVGGRNGANVDTGWFGCPTVGAQPGMFGR